MEDTIVNEKNKYNKAYTELMFCVDDLRKMLDTEELEKRSFISKVDTLKDYIEFLDNLEKESKKDKGLFKKLFKIENDSNQKISKYLTLDKLRDLEKIDKSQEFIDIISSLFESCENNYTEAIEVNEVQKVSDDLNVPLNLMNPGINEAARAILRRNLEKLLVVDKNDKDVQ